MRRLRDLIAAAARRAPPARDRALRWHPGPPGDGSPATGARILAGRWHLAGRAFTATDPWDIAPSDPASAAQLHAMGWLDDVLATDAPDAAARARDWVSEWVDRHPAPPRRKHRDRGEIWAPVPAARRLSRMIGHAPALMAGMARPDPFIASLHAQAAHLGRDWPRALPGLPHAEALAGLLHAGLTLDGHGDLRDRASAALAETVTREIGPDGAIATRDPLALSELTALVGWAITALRDLGHPVPDALTDAPVRAVPVLRALRHPGGRLARFHGSGGGRRARLDRILVDSGVARRDDSGLAMGYIPIAQGMTSVIVDAAPPPEGAASGAAHASTLAFEMCSGGHAVIASCGPGGTFGADWQRAGRATASHSVLAVEGRSSARIGPPDPETGHPAAPLIHGPRRVEWQRSDARRAVTLILSHDGYVPSLGLTHLRRLVLSDGGRTLAGEDSLRAVTSAHRARLDEARTRRPDRAAGFAIRFHLHPGAEAETGLRGRATTITLPCGEVWLLRSGGEARMRVEPSVHMRPGLPAPLPALQVVFTGRVLSYATTIDWTLTRMSEASASTRS